MRGAACMKPALRCHCRCAAQRARTPSTRAPQRAPRRCPLLPCSTAQMMFMANNPTAPVAYNEHYQPLKDAMKANNLVLQKATHYGRRMVAQMCTQAGYAVWSGCLDSAVLVLCADACAMHPGRSVTGALLTRWLCWGAGAILLTA